MAVVSGAHESQVSDSGQQQDEKGTTDTSGESERKEKRPASKDDRQVNNRR